MIGTGTAADSRAQHEVLEIGSAGAYTCIMDVTAVNPTAFAAQVAQVAAAVSAQVQPPVIPVVLPPPAVCMADCPALTACWRDYLRLLGSEDRSWIGESCVHCSYTIVTLSVFDAFVLSTLLFIVVMLGTAVHFTLSLTL
jgi:hypothetical protein